MTDEQLVGKIVSGNTDVFAEIVERYEIKLVRYVTYLIHDHDAAEDVVQDTFLKAYRNLNGFDRRLKFSSWIYRIAHNEAMNVVKKSSRKVQMDDEDWENLADTMESVERTADRKLAADRLAACLNELPEKYRDPVVLNYLEQRSYREVGDILRLPVATVGVRINRAKKLLKQICERKGVKYDG